jgi:GH15 family glucan-1,4-alpha-glucosidase
MTQRIEDYALIGDLRTAALVGLDGSIDWLCMPRFDSPSVCAALLGDSANGQWILAPLSGERCTERRYRDNSLILESVWVTAEGVVRVTDFMSPVTAAPQVTRIVDGLAGEVRMRTSIKLRMGYGTTVPSLHGCTPHLAASADDMVLQVTSQDVELLETDGAWTADFPVAAGRRVSFTLSDSSAGQDAHLAAADVSLAAVEDYWGEWTSRCTYTGPWEAEVKQSLVFLKALTYTPTGAVLAAATTSLPELIGGSRNWDYRFCWLRDASFTLQAFLAAGYVDEAVAWQAWLERSTAHDSDLQIMYGIGGEKHLPERTLDWLSGYAQSAPVRIGNDAATQRQGDVWGEVLDVLIAVGETGPRPARAPELRRRLLEEIKDGWQEPDNGLWEVRGPRRHFVHSKLMSWAGVDRLVRDVRFRPANGSLAQLRALRAAIRREICTRGYNTSLQAFTQAYGSTRLDAAVLLMPRYGFLPWNDTRMISTVHAIERHLTQDGLVLRYAADDDRTNVDGLPGTEGTFLACSFWMADALQGIGRTDDAKALFERLLSLRNDVGMLSEEYDPTTGRHLGNTPQALSHAGLITTALCLSDESHHEAVAAALISNATEEGHALAC